MAKKKKRVRKPYSDEKLYRYLQRELRRTFRNSPLKAEAWKNGLIREKGMRGFYRCYICGMPFKRAEMAIDHVKPVVPVDEKPSFSKFGRGLFFIRLFCDLSNLRPACDACHDKKTKIENEARKRWKAGS